MNLFNQLKGLDDTHNIKIKCFDLWKKVFLDNAYRDSSLRPAVRDVNLYSDGSALMSGKDMISFFYTIDGYPSTLNIDFREAIRQESKGKVRVSFISLFENTRIDWDSPKMRSRLNTWETISNEAESTTEYNYRQNMRSIDNDKRRRMSLIYLADADERRRRKLFKYRTLMVVSGVRGVDFDSTIKEIQEYCSTSGIKITRVSKFLDDYLRVFSPFSLEINNKVLSEVGNTTIPDEMLSRFSTYDQGKVGKKGDYWGVDIYSGFPVFKEAKKDVVNAENILITAETGGGKSYFLKGILLQLLGNPKFTGTIMDIEGDEYIPIAGFTAKNSKVVLLNMAEGQGKYYDPVEIQLTGDEELDKDMFSFSRSFTLSMLNTLLGTKFVETNEWASVIVNEAVSRTYSDAGVGLDKMTWGRSKGLTLFDVYANIKKFYIEDKKETKGYKANKGYQDALDLCIAKLSRYFESLENGGSRSDLFRERVSLNDIGSADLVVCSFGMKGKSPALVDPIQMSLSQLSAANISHIRSLFSQARGLYNFKVWEEFQRWGNFPGSDVTITTALTGGRKLGDVNFIVTNNVKELLDRDRFGIFGNTTSFAIGAIDDAEVREKLCERLSVPLLKPDLDSLVLNKGNNESFSDGEGLSSMYDKAFLVKLDKSVVSIVRMELPDFVAKSSLFRTGDAELLKKIRG